MLRNFNINLAKMEKVSLRKKLSGWFRLSRPPFHVVGILPFFLGTVLAWKLDQAFQVGIFILGTSAVLLIMLSTYQAGEYFDEEEDRISQRIFKSRFAGGSGVPQEGILTPRVPLWTSIISLGMAALAGIILQFVLKTGPYTIPLGAIGAVAGFFYSTKPIRLVARGIGEILIGFCYGWLPVAAAFYIQTGYIHHIITWIGLPIGLTIFNVVFLNEFMDYTADSISKKKNLVVRMGREQGVLIYSAVSILSWFATFLALMAGVSPRALFVYVPTIMLSALITGLLLKGKYRDYCSLEVLCGLTIAVNLGTTSAFILAFV